MQYLDVVSKMTECARLCWRVSGWWAGRCCGAQLASIIQMSGQVSRLVRAFLLRNKCLLISWLQSTSAVILELKQIKSVTVSIVSPSICYEVMGRDATIFVFGLLCFKLFFSLSSFTFMKKLFSSSLSAIRVVSSVNLSLLIYLPGMKIPGRYINKLLCRWHHLYGRKWRTKELLDESERGEWKSWLKTKHSKN